MPFTNNAGEDRGVGQQESLALAGGQINGPPPVGLPLRQKAKGAAAALEGRLAGVEWGVLAALAA